MRRTLFCATLLVFMLSGAALAVEENVFSSPTAGLSITKPASWEFMSLAEVEENRARARLEDEELEQLVRTSANAPLVVMTKYPEPHPTLNPSVQVMLRPLGPLDAMPATDILRAVVPALEKGFAEFRLIDAVSEIRVAGLTAAQMRARYLISNTEGETFDTMSRMIVVPRGKFMFLISMSGPAEGEAEAFEEFEGILASLRIDR